MSPAEFEGQSQCFAVRRGEVNGKALGAQLYSPELRLFLKRLTRNHASIKPLRSYVEINPSIKISCLASDLPVSFIPMDAVEDGASGRIRFQSRPLSEVQKGYTPFAEGDILWAKITPCMQNGKSCIARGLQNGIGFGSTEFHVLRVLDSGEVLTEFVWEFLSQKSLRRVATYAFTGSAGHQRVPESFLAELPFPILPLDKQSELVDRMSVARVEILEKRQEANDLLASLDSYVLEALGLTLPTEKRGNVYGVRLHNARERFDPDYNSPHFRTLRNKIEHGKYPAQSINSLFDPIISGFAAGGNDQTDDPSLGIPHIRPLNISNTAELHFSNTKMVPRGTVEPSDILKKGEILFNNTNSMAWVGKTVVFDINRECACSNHITRLSLIDKRYDPYYFAGLFNALRGLGFFGLLATNFNNQAGINVETLKEVYIPVPKPEVQRKIAEEIGRRRKNAYRLRDEATRIWEEAEREFQEVLLGLETGE